MKALAKLATKDGQPALAVTDRNNLFGALEFAETLAGAGIQPIIGCTLALAKRRRKRQGRAQERQRLGLTIIGSIALLAKDGRAIAIS